MKRVYRGWFFSTLPDGRFQAVKRNQRIIADTELQLREEIDRISLKELMEDENE